LNGVSTLQGKETNLLQLYNLGQQIQMTKISSSYVCYSLKYRPLAILILQLLFGNNAANVNQCILATLALKTYTFKF
jgi:hypothetical protein